jgi:hypothetical protein
VIVGKISAGMIAALVQLLVALTGAVLISAAVQGFKAEWQALFRRQFEGAPARILVYAVSAFFQLYNGSVHGLRASEIVILALLTALSATGFYHFAKKMQPA